MSTECKYGRRRYTNAITNIEDAHWKIATPTPTAAPSSSAAP